MKNLDKIEYWSKTEKLIRDLTLITEELLIYFNGKSYGSEFQRVLHTFLMRIHTNFFAIHSISEKYLNEPSFKFSIYILLRPLIADLIMQMYMIEGKNEDEFMKRYNDFTTIYFKNLHNLLYDKDPVKNLGKEVIHDLFKNQFEHYPEHFEKTFTKVKKVGDKSPKKLIQELKSDLFVNLKDVYYTYFLLSQFEHFSEKTEDFMRWDYKVDYELIKDCCVYLLQGMILNVANLDGRNELYYKVVEVKNYIVNS